MIYNVMLVSGIWQNESVIDIATVFEVLFPYRLLQSIEQHSLCHTVVVLITYLFYI